MTTRESIYSALYNLLHASASFASASRKFKMYTDLNASDFPALTMAQIHESYKNNGTGLPPSKTFNCEVYVYCSVDQSATGASPASQINTLLDAIDAALAPGPNGRQTLGGLVWNTNIDNTINIEDGTVAGVAIAIIPIIIRVTQ